MNKILQILFLCVNSLFVAKYTIRLGYNPVITTILYCLFTAIVIFFISKASRLENQNSKILFFTSIFSVICIIAILHSIINPFNLQVDRWSAIHNFLQNLFNGVYPYAAHTHLGGYGSPFPAWQVFHIPFYFLGNVGLGMLFSVILLSVFLIWHFNSYKKALFYIILLAISPAFWYEVAVRSDLIYNFMLCLISIGFVYKKKYTIQNQAFSIGVLCGLFLSTRLTVIIPFAIFLLPSFFKAKLEQKIIFIFTSLIIFVLTFLPFIFWNFKSLFFFEFNPFILQTRQGTSLEILILLLLVLYFSKLWKNNFKLCCSYISITFIIFIALTFTHRMLTDNFANGLFSSSYDITYFNMALPFIIFSISDNGFYSSFISKKTPTNN